MSNRPSPYSFNRSAPAGLGSSAYQRVRDDIFECAAVALAQPSNTSPRKVGAAQHEELSKSLAGEIAQAHAVILSGDRP